MGGGGWANPFAESNWEVISGLVRIPMDSRVCGRCSVSDERSDSCRTLPNNIEKLPTFSEHPREPGTGLGRILGPINLVIWMLQVNFCSLCFFFIVLFIFNFY